VPLSLVSPGVGWIRSERVRRRGWQTLGASAAVAMLSWALMIPLDAPSLFLLSILAGLTGIGSAVVIASAARSSALRWPGTVRIADGQIAVAGTAMTATVPLTEVVDGWIEHPHGVRLRVKDGRTLAVDAPDAQTADAMLVAAGVGPAQRVVSVPLSSSAAVTAGGRALATAGIALIAPALLFMIAVISVGLRDALAAPSAAGVLALIFIALFTGLLGFGAAALLSTLRRREAIVGLDGVTFRQSRRRIFVPYAEMTGVEPDARGVAIHRTKGGSVTLPTWQAGEALLPGPGRAPTDPLADGVVRQRVLLDRIGKAARASRRGSADLDELDRRGRSLEAWRADVRRLAKSPTGYRSTSLTSADLADVVEDVGAPPERRIAAAMGLADSEDAGAKERVRVVIDTCADEELKEALEHAAAIEAIEADPIERVLGRA
jgi:hypothetical protein